MPLVAAPPSDFVPDSEFKPDPPEFVPDTHPSAPAAVGADFIPDAKFVPDSETYGTPAQQAIAGIEGVARGATLGLSDVAERGLGISTPEAMAARQRENPWTSGLGTAAGAAGIGALTGGGSLVAEGLGGGALAGAVGLGAEGAVFGAGNAVSEAALGDGQLNGEKLLSHMGWGAALGGAAGSVFGKLGAFSKGAEGAVDAAESAGAEAGALAEPVLKGIETAENAGPIKSFADLEARNAKAQATGKSFDLPQKSVLAEAAARLPDLENPALPQQIDALSSKSHLDAYKILRESDSQVGKAVQNYEGLQKAELVSKIDNSIEALHPESAPVVDAVKAGHRAVEAFTEQYEAEKNALKPMFEELKKVDLGSSVDHVHPIIDKFAEAVPGVARMFGYGEDGLLNKVLPYDTKWGIDHDTYNAVKQAYKSLAIAGAEDAPATFQDLSNIRKGLSQNVNVLSQGQGPQEIRAIKAAMMSYIEDAVQEHLPETPVRDVFKRWAVNEQQRGVIEKAFGAGVGTPEFGAISKIKPENISDNIFKNTATINAAKSILEPRVFDELLANHLAEQRAAVTRNGVFSSNKFATFLKNHQDSLGVAFAESPQNLQRLKDLTTFSTILPDSASVNPSGTAKTLMGMIKNLSVGDMALGAMNPKAMIALIGKKAFDMLKESRLEKQAIREFNNGLVSTAEKAAHLDATKRAIDAFNANLDRAAKAIFQREDSHAQ